jgi:hypothetical protein
MHQAYRLSGAVRRDIGQVKTASLVLHALDDDVASTRSAEFVARNVGTPEVRTVLYRESYHILTMDNDKDAVADETIGFFRRHGAHASPPESASDRTSPDPRTWMQGFGEDPDSGHDTGGSRLELDLTLPNVARV